MANLYGGDRAQRWSSYSSVLSQPARSRARAPPPPAPFPYTTAICCMYITNALLPYTWRTAEHILTVNRLKLSFLHYVCLFWTRFRPPLNFLQGLFWPFCSCLSFNSKAHEQQACTATSSLLFYSLIVPLFVCPPFWDLHFLAHYHCSTVIN